MDKVEIWYFLCKISECCLVWQQSCIQISAGFKTVGFFFFFTIFTVFIAAHSFTFIGKLSHRTKALCCALNIYSRAAFSLERWCVTWLNTTELLLVPERETDIAFIKTCHHDSNVDQNQKQRIYWTNWWISLASCYFAVASCWGLLFPEWTDIYFWLKLSLVHMKHSITHSIMNHFLFVIWQSWVCRATSHNNVVWSQSLSLVQYFKKNVDISHNSNAAAHIVITWLEFLLYLWIIYIEMNHNAEILNGA